MALLPIPDRQVHAWEVEVVGDSNGAMASYHTRNESNHKRVCMYVCIQSSTFVDSTPPTTTLS